MINLKPFFFSNRFFVSKNSFKKLFQSAEQNIIDYPLFWNYCSIVIAKALLALSNNDNRKKDVFKAINNSFGEIVGNDCNTFKSCLDNVLKNVILCLIFQKKRETINFFNLIFQVDIKQKAAAEELLSLLNENSHSVVEVNYNFKRHLTYLL